MLDAHPELCSTLPSVINIISELRNDPENSELELRFGRISNTGKFVAGVSLQDVEKFIARLNTNVDIPQTDWAEHHDFFFPVDGVMTRQRTIFNINTLCIDSEVVQKVCVKQVVVRDEKSGNACRVALSKEFPVEMSRLPLSTTTNRVRIQQRKVYTWSSNGTAPQWQYEISNTWSGDTRGDAETNKTNCAPTYEFEIEARHDQLLASKSDAYIAASLLLKATDFFSTPYSLCMHR
tara:strand:+ start:2682 stop:3389 length:708 start_codon:yes stop_codon:yes gene_type:complete